MASPARTIRIYELLKRRHILRVSTVDTSWLSKTDIPKSGVLVECLYTTVLILGGDDDTRALGGNLLSYTDYIGNPSRPDRSRISSFGRNCQRVDQPAYFGCTDRALTTRQNPVVPLLGTFCPCFFVTSVDEFRALRRDRCYFC